ncbi:hypothetical protein [Spirillospora sp. NPDC047279]|uniref:hypothetical protein n=1 Tax=Spirillospora sp. NPDC047279 TaxID=3155478 RepID=UPI0033FDF555
MPDRPTDQTAGRPADKPADRAADRAADKAADRPGADLPADERAKAAGTGEAAGARDTHVAGPTPGTASGKTDSDVATSFPKPQHAAPASQPPAHEPTARPAAAQSGAAQAPATAPPGPTAAAATAAQPQETPLSKDAPGSKDTPSPKGTPAPKAAPAGTEERIERLLEVKDAERFRERWHEVQANFVDDPREAVKKADELTTEVVEAMKQAVGSRKRSLDDRWRSEKEDDQPDTERHRLALRAYRDLVDRLLST